MKRLLPAFCLIFLTALTTLNAQNIERWERFEVRLNADAKGNPFTDTRLTATFKCGDTSLTVNGFYDGNGVFKVRFMPPITGNWTYRTQSNDKRLNGKTGSFECIASKGKHHGMVQVSDTYYFRYADGSPYYPVGTTAYAWTHMSADVQKMTLESLKESGFNKVRMCIFPKNYDLVKEEPELYPFEIKEIQKDAKGKETKIWDYTRFNPAFFKHLETCVDQLADLGIEADLILFHPYDKGRWGFDGMPQEVNLLYINYLTARMASFHNVWWSIANEWDLVKQKTHADWEALSKETAASDPYGHLCSIHGATGTYYEYWEPQFTHASVQDEAPVMHPGAAQLLRSFLHKPVLYDEVGYEGNLSKRWGRYSPEEMTYLMWMGAIAGTYVTHGECYLMPDAPATGDTLFWGKGGRFRGESWKRAAFLRSIFEDCPHPLQMADVSRDMQTATGGDNYFIVYLGKEIRESWLFDLPMKNASASYGYKKPVKGTRFQVEIMDTYGMTITRYPDTFESAGENDYRVRDKDGKRVRLPMKPYLALRITEIP